MFKISKIGQNRLDIELSGKLNSGEMQTALDELESKPQDIKNGIMPRLKVILEKNIYFKMIFNRLFFVFLSCKIKSTDSSS